MLRFVPDSLAEGLLRPFLMADPVAGLYLEDTAPDWRFAVFLLVYGAAMFMRRSPKLQSSAQGLMVLGTVGMMYLWIFASGNGRYFSWGLLLIGPLLVMACFLLPVSRSRQWTILGLAMVLQTAALSMSHTTNMWAVVRTSDTTLPMDSSDLRTTPAVFLTLSNLSYSVLVPLFHPQSRWANVAGQYNILPGTIEWPRLLELLRSSMPRYLVVPVRLQDYDPGGQPTGHAKVIMTDVLEVHSMALVDGGCRTLWSALSGPGRLDAENSSAKRGFWICAVQPIQSSPHEVASADQSTSRTKLDALDQVELRCPRFFPPGGGQASLVQGTYQRSYAGSDVRLWIDPEGLVMFQYYRAMNPSLVGNVDEVGAGRFNLPCAKLPGRYQPFWQRE